MNIKTGLKELKWIVNDELGGSFCYKKYKDGVIWTTVLGGVWEIGRSGVIDFGNGAVSGGNMF